MSLQFWKPGLFLFKPPFCISFICKSMFLVSIPLPFSIISPFGQDNIFDKTADIVNGPNVPELRKLFLNLFTNISLLQNKTTATIILSIIERLSFMNGILKSTLCFRIITVTCFYVSYEMSGRYTESKKIFLVDFLKRTSRGTHLAMHILI